MGLPDLKESEDRQEERLLQILPLLLPLPRPLPPLPRLPNIVRHSISQDSTGPTYPLPAQALPTNFYRLVPPSMRGVS